MSARILIVEDEEPLTMLLRYNLEKEGYEVDSAARGDDGVGELQSPAPAPDGRAHPKVFLAVVHRFGSLQCVVGAWCGACDSRPGP